MALAYGSGNHLYSLIVLYHKTEMALNFTKLQGILAPFPWWVWMCIVTFAISTSYLLDIAVEHAMKRPLLNSFGSCLVFTSLLVDQGAPAIRRQYGLWSVWAIFSLIISNAYRGFLFLSLAVTAKPSSPQTIDELVESKLLVGTTMQYQNIETKEGGPALGDLILPKLMMYGTSSNTTRKTYAELQASTMWFQVNLKSLPTFSVRLCLNRTALVGKSYQNITVPKQLAIFDWDFLVERYKSLFEEINTYWVSKPFADTRIGISSMATTSNNYLFPIITNSIAQVYESGMYIWWHSVYSAYARKTDKKEVKSIMMEIKKKLPLKLTMVHGVPREVYLQIFLHYWAFIGVSLGMFILEFFKNLKQPGVFYTKGVSLKWHILI